MGDFFQNIRNAITNLWNKWSTMQRAIGLGIFALLLVGLVSLFFWGGSSVQTAVFNVSIQDQVALDRMALRLDRENISYTVSNGKIYVANGQTARMVRALLVQEDLVPKNMDPWSVFDVQRWTTSQFENDVRLRRAITQNLNQHITALETIDSASVTLVTPKKEILRELQEPTTASVILTPRPGVDLLEDKKQVQGIVRLISFAVAGLSADNITVLDNNGLVLNDFDSLKDFDRLALGTKILKQKKIEEAELTRKIAQSLSAIVSRERLEIINVAIDLDYIDRKERSKEYLPITLKKDNPETPYDETEILAPAPISEVVTKENFEGSAFNPEGPAGQEGQTPPGYKELENTPGKYVKDSTVNNYQYGELEKEEIASPLETQKIAVGVAIDGTWERLYDKSGNVQVVNGKIQREYKPVPPEILESIRNVLKNSLGINEVRGDTVIVENIPFDRSREFDKEDETYAGAVARRRILLVLLGVLAALIVLGLLLRIVMQERERRKRAREEELARQHQAMRESALRAAEEDIANSQMAVANRGNIELQESAVNLTRDNPQGVAQLIRMWIADD
ncbi:flagellar basal-body MS-ring/collar protein FliF [Candidatus Haliotispira prima]|uniref:Flagellar basal-body MS-ring/collar protein FliF n=1 Tax=Candidatus Haliotispira prima TaxID=3034016 RepID=A0ABY8MG35_9SPIO|nr:flagellar basal-body MS-ring/collar protein FliF [Candidatus Haliotispira prima]